MSLGGAPGAEVSYVCTNTAGEWAKVRAAMASAAAKNRPLRLLPGIAGQCLVDSAQTTPSGITLRFGGVNITCGLPSLDAHSNSPFYSAGLPFSSSTTPTADIAAGAINFTLTSATGYATGSSIILIDSGTTYQFIRTISLTGSVATLDSALPRPFTKATTTVQVAGGVASNVVLDGEGTGVISSSLAYPCDRGVELIGCQHCEMRGFSVQSAFSSYGVSFDQGGRDNTIRDVTVTLVPGASTTVGAAIEGNEGSRMVGVVARGAFSVAGIQTNMNDGVSLSGCMATGSAGDGFDVATQDSGASSPIGNQGTTLTGCSATDNVGAGFKVDAGASNAASPVRFVGVSADRNNYGLNVSSGGPVIVDGASFATNASNGIRFSATNVGSKLSNVVLYNNQASAPTDTSLGDVYLTDSSDVTFASLRSTATAAAFRLAGGHGNSVRLKIDGWDHLGTGAYSNGIYTSGNSAFFNIIGAHWTFTGCSTFCSAVLFSGTSDTVSLDHSEIVSMANAGNGNGVFAGGGGGHVVKLGAVVNLSAATGGLIAGGGAAVSEGTSTCNGTNGVSISYPAATSNSAVMFSRKTAGSTQCTNAPTWAVSAGTGFTMTCSTTSCNDVMRYQVVER